MIISLNGHMGIISFELWKRIFLSVMQPWTWPFGKQLVKHINWTSKELFNVLHDVTVRVKCTYAVTCIQLAFITFTFLWRYCFGCVRCDVIGKRSRIQCKHAVTVRPCHFIYSRILHTSVKSYHCQESEISLHLTTNAATPGQNIRIICQLAFVKNLKCSQYELGEIVKHALN